MATDGGRRCTTAYFIHYEADDTQRAHPSFLIFECKSSSYGVCNAFAKSKAFAKSTGNWSSLLYRVGQGTTNCVQKQRVVKVL